MHEPMGFNLHGYIATIRSSILILRNTNLTNVHLQSQLPHAYWISVSKNYEYKCPWSGIPRISQ